ncbi:16S rRNA (cytosine(967)-C(5))-methyltransferase RsmB [Aedoeadaptatus coxii]|uniref:16S rRNA (cytosine(967)-C(5))-methyltransferase RsmB n=1 Tax=Aedoeadaptatus coxii TaxID=755172 RepID=UPI002AD568CC|nr:16S rRNA (cytosine(967)-C(5))-methyltransferase RsmB [Peptoniphilus coxii]
MKNPRFTALKTLQKVAHGEFIQDAFDRKGLNPKDERLAETIINGTIQHELFLDYVIDQFVSNTDKLQANLRILLRMSIYQIRFLDRVPNRAIVDESVKIAKKIANQGAGGLVNGVLRSIIREGDDAFKIKADDDIRYLSLRYSFSEEWVKYFKTLLGNDVEKFLASTFSPAPITIRPIHTDKQELRISLEEEGFELSDAEVGETALNVENPQGLFDSKAFHNGHFYVQDGASQEVVSLFTRDVKAEALDLCAAPGGKSFQMAEIFHHVLSCDSNDERLELMDENIKRLGYENITTQVRNAKTPLPKKTYDRILVDAPCSGLGLLRRKPEIKHRVTLDDVLRLAQTQRLILENAYHALATGGELVYSTCTVTVEENEGVLASFLKDHPECTLKNKGIRYWPHQKNCDGFSMAVIVRKDDYALDGNDAQ